VPTWYQEKCSTNVIFAEPNKTASDESVIRAIKTAHSLGMKVMLKPHLDILDISDGNWRGTSPARPTRTGTLWFDNYGAFIVHYATMAEPISKIFCIGTELSSVSSVKENFMEGEVIAPVREAYKGPITYAANWMRNISRQVWTRSTM